MKQRIKRILSVITACAILFTLTVPAWAAGNKMKCYTISTTNTKVYADAALSKGYGTIFSTDELEVLVISGNYVKVKYPIRNGTKTGYIPRSAILLSTSGKNYYAKEKITTYRRASTANSYGEIYANDKVLVLGTRGSYTQVRYPVNWGYKFAFIKTSDANRALYGKTNDSDGDNAVSISEGTYSFCSALNSNYVMDVNGNSSANGTNIQLWKSNNTNAQKYKIESEGQGYYRIKNIGTGKVVDVQGGQKGSGVNVQLWEYNGTDAQLWRFYSAGDGYYYVRNKLGYYLDAEGGEAANGTNIWVYEGNSSKAQKWKLVAETENDAEAQVRGRLDQIANGTLTYNSKTVLAVGKKFVGTRSNEQCKGYAKNVFDLCFGVTPNSTQPKPNNHLLYSISGMSKVGSVTNMTTSNISALFLKARPGDFVQMRRTHTGSHSAIVYSVSSTGVTFMEANTDNNNGIKEQNYSWSELCSKNAKMSVYTATNYQLK